MADELGSKLGFDASDAINSIQKLKRELDSYNSTLEKTAGGSKNFNSEQIKADDILKRLSTSAQIAVGHLKSLTSTQNQAAASANNLASAQSKLAQTSFQKAIGINPNAAPAPSGDVLFGANQQKQIEQLKATEVALRSVARTATETGKTVAAGAQQGAEGAKTLELGWRSLIRVFGIQFAARAVASVVSAFVDGIKAAKDFEIQLAEIQTISKEFAAGSINDVASVVERLSAQFGRPVEDVAKGLYQTLSNQIGDAAESTRFLTDALEFSVATVTSTENAVDLLSGVLNAYGLTAASTTRISDELFKTIELGRVTGTELANTYGRITTLSAQLGVSTAEVDAALAELTINGVKASDALTQLSNLYLKLVQPSTNLKKAFKELGVASAEAGILLFGLEGFLQKLAGNKTALSEVADLLGGRIRAIRGASTLLTNAERLNKELIAIQQSAGATRAAFELINQTNAQKLNTQLDDARNSVIEFGRSAISALVTFIELVGGAKIALTALATGIGTLVGGALLVFFTQSAAALFGLSSSITVAAASVTALNAVIVAAAAAVLVLTGNFLSAQDGIKNIVSQVSDLQKLADIDIKINVAKALPGIQAAQTAVKTSGQLIEQNLSSQLLAVNKAREANLLSNSIVTQDLATHVAHRKTLLESGVKALESVLNTVQARTKSLSDQILGVIQAADKAQFERKVGGLEDPADQATARLRAIEDLSREANGLSLLGNPDDQKKSVDLLQQAFDQAQKLATLKGFEQFGEKAINDLRQRGLSLAQNIAETNAEQAKSAAATLATDTALTEKSKTISDSQTRVAVAVRTVGKELENNTNNLIVFQRQAEVSSAAVTVSIDQISASLAELRNKLSGDVLIQDGTADKVIANFESVSKKARDAISSGNKQAITESQEGIARLLQGFGDDKNKSAFAKSIEAIFGDSAKIIRDELNDLSTRLTTAQSDQAKLAIAKQAASDTLDQASALSELSRAASEGKDILEQLPAFLQGVGQGARESSEGLQKASDALKGVNENAPAAVDGLNSVQAAIDGFNVNNIIGQVNAGIAALQQLAAATANPGGFAQFGGRISYFAGGGHARGTDTIPTMLSKGEFVVNSRDARKFFPQLVAMNSGRTPNFRQSGGDVTNVGDINVTVAGGRNSQQTVTEIANGLERQIRQRRINFKRGR